MILPVFRLMPGFLALAFLATACNPEPVKVVFGGKAQGTTYSVTYYDAENRDLQPQIDSILKAFDLSLSIWAPGSLISRMNEEDTTVMPDAWFLETYDLSRQISEETDGAFDFTIGPLVNAWGFGFKGKLVMDSTLVDSLRRLVDYRKIRLTAEGRIVKPANMRFDFNAIAQGYAVDVLGRYLESKGMVNYLIEIGGEVLAIGAKPGNQPWRVGIENPTTDSLAGQTLNATVRLADKALATSGSYRKYYEQAGVRYSHTIDPFTGYPVRHNLLSVSVLADDCATADGYATAFMVMGLERSKAFLDTHKELEAYFIYATEGGAYLTYATEGFRKVLE
jgi:thiamine biosynthesis lipoprotein